MRSRLRWPRDIRTQRVYPGYLQIPASRGPNNGGGKVKQMIYTLTPSGGDDTAAIQAVLTAAPDLSIVEIQPGNYKITSGLVCLDKRLNIFAYGATFNWQGTNGTVLTVGFSPSSVIAGTSLGADWLIEGLTIHEVGNHEAYFLNTSTGLCVQNVFAGRFRDLDIDGFGTGLYVLGDGTGSTYSRYEMRQMLNNFTSLKTRILNSGFTTELTFVGGRWQYGPVGIGHTPTHVDILGPNVSGIRFLECSFEATPGATWARISKASYCNWINNRYESSDLSALPIIIDSSCQKIDLLGGVDADTLVNWQDGSGGTKDNRYLPRWH